MALSPPSARRLADNLARVRGAIDAAAARAGRPADAVQLVAVTKYVGPEIARALVEAGCIELGESRPQELWRKAEALADTAARWHLIGHLQTNKVRRTVPLVSLIHSVDTWRLIESLDAEAAALSARLRIFLEVNMAGEAAKHGFDPQNLPEVCRRLGEWANLDVRGLMTMGPLEGGAEAARRAFAGLRELAARLQPFCPDGTSLAELSMGMSGDFEVAIEEGATIVRVGSALFEGVA
ncbi:MAG: YggS family pyridoxal phosphate-dependent enzyme [Pirellulales bacterium]|nr:YggS family pyridoxal phosphate-dependent enzyme [Pirellulales bacterium]